MDNYHDTLTESDFILNLADQLSNYTRLWLMLILLDGLYIDT